ncbi:MAG TPA: MMPL family transporter [Kineosporiaceae bacterium]|nr:MMPL family transporter [Kineosporiaceae bacterium]
MLRSLGGLAARHPRWFVVGWLALVGAGFAAALGGAGGQPLFDRLHSGAPRVPSDSATGQDLLDRTSRTGPSVMLLLDRVDPASPAVRTAVTAAAADLARSPLVLTVRQPYAAPPGTAGPAPASPAAAPPATANPLVSADGHAVLVIALLKPDLSADRQQSGEATITTRLERVAAQVPGSRGLVGGVDSLVGRITSQVKTDLGTGESIALPASLLVMILVFGGLLAAGLPIVGAVASIAGALACLLGFSYAIELEASVVNVVTVLSLGLCIDYGLLLVSRYREELRRLHAADVARGLAPDTPPGPQALQGALEHTLATAGRTVMFSGITVAVSCCGLLLFASDTLQAIGAAAVSVVVVALLVALTLVPALLALAGDRLIRPGLVRRLLPGVGDVAPVHGTFSRLARGVQRRPALVLVGVLAVLVLAGVPSLRMQLVNSGTALLPVSDSQRQLFDGVDARFPAAAEAPLLVVTTAPVSEVQPWASRELAALPGVRAVDPVQEQGDATTGTVSVVAVRPEGTAESSTAQDVLRRIRALHPGFRTYVTGQTPYVVDFVDGIRARAPYAVGLIVLATFVLLFLMTGSVLVPLKALLMNVVSLGAALGMMVLVFQDGHLSGLLGFTSAGGIETMLPPLTLAFGFGLAMDYEVFLLSRIKEFHDRGEDNDASVVRGLQASGRIITSAALIVVLVFGGFVAGQLLLIKEMGVALAVAVAVDATLVRMLLVPATMTLLGEWNWWAPKRLRAVHERFGLREG